MDAVPLDRADLRSRHVRVSDMEWQETRFPGCEVKTLLFDPDSGLVTVLMRFAPGAVLPDHEHVKIEQTYVLEGKLVDRDGPDADLTVPQGDFVWRPAGSRHSAWCPEGGLILAIFQLPNKFFESDGRVTDIAGRDWAEIWGAIDRAGYAGR
jgi:anti-sigma factor ChrR (cupin superfamily)